MHSHRILILTSFFACLCCERVYFDTGSLAGERPYICDFPGCRRTFAQRSNLKHHIAKHAEGGDLDADDAPESTELPPPANTNVDSNAASATHS